MSVKFPRSQDGTPVSIDTFGVGFDNPTTRQLVSGTGVPVVNKLKLHSALNEFRGRSDGTFDLPANTQIILSNGSSKMLRDLKPGESVQVKGTLKHSFDGNPALGQAAMLVLSRKKNESIVINEDIVITVVEVRGDKVRLGIQAPREVPVTRSEILGTENNNSEETEDPSL